MVFVSFITVNNIFDNRKQFHFFRVKKYNKHKNLVYLESIINNDQALKDNLHDYIYGSYSQLTRDYIKEQFFILLDKFSVLDNKKEDYTILITEAKFKNDWDAKYTGKTINKAKGSKDGVTAGAPSAGAKPTKSLFAK